MFRSLLFTAVCAAVLMLASCASEPIDPHTVDADDTLRQPQCPIGYRAEYRNNIVIKSDKKEEQWKRTESFECVPE